MTSGWVTVDAKDGRLDFSTIKRTDDEIMLDVTFEHSNVAETEITAWRNQTERAIRLKFTGATTFTTTDTYDTNTFIMNLYGKWLTFGAEGLEDQNGDNIYRGTFKVAYSSAAGAKASFVVVTEQATLP